MIITKYLKKYDFTTNIATATVFIISPLLNCYEKGYLLFIGKVNIINIKML